MTRAVVGAGRPSWRQLISIPTLERLALPLFVVVMIAFFSVFGATSDVFPTAANLQNVLGNQAVVATAALAAVIPLVAGQFDVSVGPVLGLSSVACASAMSHGWPMAAAIVVSLVAAAAVGVVNGILVAYVGVNSFIVTLAAGTLVGGLVSLYTANATIIEGVSAGITDFGSALWLGLPDVVWVVLGVAVLLGLSIARTTYGRRLTSVGINQSAARLVGINVRAVTASSFVLSSVLAGAAGVLLLARTGSGNPQVGSGYTLAALSAAFLGATAFRPGQFNVPGTLVGVLFVAVSVNGLTLAGAHDWVDPVFNGAALMAALALSTLLGRARVAGAHSGAKPRRHGRAAMAERPVDPGGDAPSTQQVVERSPVPPVEARAAGRKHSE